MKGKFIQCSLCEGSIYSEREGGGGGVQGRQSVLLSLIFVYFTPVLKVLLCSHLQEGMREVEV